MPRGLYRPLRYSLFYAGAVFVRCPGFFVPTWRTAWQMNNRELKEGKEALSLKLVFFDMYMNFFFRREDAGEAEWGVRRQSRDSCQIVL